jgi:hypothetical protein
VLLKNPLYYIYPIINGLDINIIIVIKAIVGASFAEPNI